MDLSIAVVSHGHEPYLPRCLESLAGAVQGLSVEFLVLDNLGRGLNNCLANIHPGRLTLLDNTQPLGFAANVNLVAGQARGKYILILNPDTTHACGRLCDMLELLEREATAGIVACRLLNQDGTVQQSYRRFPTVPVAISRMLNADHWPRRPQFYRYRLMENEQFTDNAAVDWVFGAFMLLRRQQFDSFGGMDARFRLYYEDVDLCYRYRLAGLNTIYFPSVAFVHHHLRISAANPFSPARRWHATSMIRYFAKHHYLFRPPVDSSNRLAP